MAYKEINLKTFESYLCLLPNKCEWKYRYHDITKSFNNESIISSNEYIFEMYTDLPYVQIIIFSSVLLEWECCRKLWSYSIKIV